MTGEDLKHVRETLKLSQAAFAKKIAVCDAAYVCAMERNRRPISKRTETLAKMLYNAAMAGMA